MLTLPISFSSPIVISLSILTAVGAYVLFGPDLQDRRRRGYPGGLVNYGNNCFANAIVQCLASSSIFVRWVEEHLQNNIVAKILLDLIKSINGESISYSQESTVATLIDRMRQPKWLSPFEQQDSHEFLLSLINSLTARQPIESRRFGFAACLDSDEQDMENSMMPSESPLIKPHPFQGLQATQLQCTQCKNKNPISVSLFETLSLMIPERQISNSGLFSVRYQRNFTLQELIGNYLKSEIISNLTCSKCKSKENLSHRKITTFSRLPEILCLHIIRTTWTNEGWPTKNTSHVSFPDHLDMNAFISLSRLLPANIHPTQTTIKPSAALYRLNSVLVHLGGISEAGHFIVYRRRINSKEWFSISDDHIRECNELEVFSSMAYILFYERIKKFS
ncbi:unnamed protein product [Rotaria socialis]|uniref:Ubiquitin carboxyl-terminal hydrolase n=1 Tax=Rotaria socialis TaxID=392032 RepID=A0A821PKK5_9BILA|nr:unnamed protein product [Rotaria socialis]CAF4807861.1 unnamed protein product [Rotaria socialis]